MAYAPVDVIEVKCWDSRVGAIAADPRSGYYAFEYDPSWLNTGIELTPTTMPTTSGGGVFVFPSLDPATFHRLPSMVADSLPDAFGNALTTAYLASEGIADGDITALDRLAYLGTRGVGALEFHPVRGPRTRTATAIELSTLVAAARRAISGQASGTDEEATNAVSQLIAVGTSAGGARAKAVVALNPMTGELRSGQVAAPVGFESWILKLDGVGQDNDDLGPTQSYGRIEYAYSLMARDAGIEMTDCRLLEEGGRAHFMTRRFDRPIDGSKVHVQTMCALAQLDFRQIDAHDYAQLFILGHELGLQHDSQAELYRRMVFNVAAANCDDHTKNFAFMLPRNGAWKLSPAYDITRAHSPTSIWTKAHLMAVNGRRVDITRQDLVEVADRFEIPGYEAIIGSVLGATADWMSYAREAGVPEAPADSVQRDIQTWSGPLH